MKIDPVKGPDKKGTAQRRRQAKRVDGPSFQDVLGSTSSQQVSELDNLFREIDESGDKLRENPRLDNFEAYRERVARFLKLYLKQAYDIKLTSEMTLTGRQRHLVLVKKIDEKLEALYHLFLQEMLDIEELLKGMEEVRGMLLDLYR